MQNILGALMRQWGGILSLIVLITTLGSLYAISLPPVFSSSARLSVKPPSEAPTNDLQHYLDEQRSRVLGHEVAEAVVAKLRMDKAAARRAARQQKSGSWVSTLAGLLNWRDWATDPYESIDLASLNIEERRYLLAEMLLPALSVETDVWAETLNITYEHESPAQAARLANAFAEVFIEQTQNLTGPTKGGTRSEALAEVESARDAVKQLETALSGLRRGPSDTNMARPTEYESAQAALPELKSALQKAERELAVIEQRHDKAQQISLEPSGIQAINGVFSDPTIRKLTRDFATAQEQVADLESRMTAQHPLMQDAYNRLEAAKSELLTKLTILKADLDAELRYARTRVTAVEAELKQAEDTLAKTDDRNDQTEKLAQLLGAEQKRLVAAEARFADLPLADALPMPIVTIMEKAQIPTQPFKPDRAGIVVKALAWGIGLGLLFGFVRDWIQRQHGDAQHLVKNS